MGRVKLEIKKIEKRANRQVTFSKRSNGLMKKAQELSVLCDVDIAVIAFSPSGMLTQFSTDDKIEEVITRYANTPQHERTKAKSENVESLNKVVQKLTDARGLEALRVGYADLLLEVQQLRSQVKKTTVERNVFEQEARLIVGTNEYINNFNSPAELLYTRSQLVKGLEKIEERMRQLERQQGPAVSQNIVQQTSFEMINGLPARDESNVGSTADSAQAMHMNNWGGVHNLDNTTSIMANSQLIGSPQHIHMNNCGGVHNLDNITSIIANSQMRGQLHSGDTDYSLCGSSLHHQPQHASPTLETSSSGVDVFNKWLDSCNPWGNLLLLD